ncbi:MAG TPA: NAD(P)-dependent oxidoreductase [Gemmatimonadaceae bacterium]|jgi:3-hydroxyisobutyrate dehydrogenase-like beta-hydroxyacid dehydrogenase|nr:NAD(P)-dependent oxidoreductase [Gemmatimonadaceae bacterium]
MRIGFIGLGRMGVGMAGRLVDAGHTLAVYNRTAQRGEKLRERGAVLAETPEAAARGAEVVFTMLADDPAVEHVVFAADGILAAMDNNAVHVSASTISVSLARRLMAAHARAGQRYVSAPVFGRPDAAAAGRLFVVAGGPDDVLAYLQPLFEAIGQRTYRMSADPSNANLVKLSGNFMLFAAIEALAEAFALVRKAGVDVAAFKDLLTSSLFNAPVYHTYGDLLVSANDQNAGFTVPLALKDVRLAIAAAESLRVPMPVASLVHDAFVSAMARGYESRDQAVLGRVAAENAGIKV